MYKGSAEGKRKQFCLRARPNKNPFCGMLKLKRTGRGCPLGNQDNFNFSNIPIVNKFVKSEKDFSLRNSTHFSDTMLSLRGVNKFFASSNRVFNSTNLNFCTNFTKSSNSLNYANTANYLKNTLEKLSKLRKKRKVNLDLCISHPNLRSAMSGKKSSEISGGSTSHHLNLHYPSEESEQSSFLLSISASSTSSDPSSYTSYSTHVFTGTRSRKYFRKYEKKSIDNLLTFNPYFKSRSLSSKSAPSTCQNKSKNYELRRKANKENLMPSSGTSLEVDDHHETSTSAEGFPNNCFAPLHTSHLIPIGQARQRNYLHGRTALNSLLGSQELERTLPGREVRLFIGTWNMNGQSPEELNDFLLPPCLEHIPDIIAVGTQETYSERFEWEVSIQETLGPSHVLFHSASLGALHLVIFVRRDLLWFCSIPEEDSYSTRTGTSYRTKGAVGIGFMLFGSSYLFITSHLTAHMAKVKGRIHDVKRITRSLDLPKLIPVHHKSKDVTQNYDYVFWFGDLNFRLVQSRKEIIQWINGQHFPLQLPHSLNNDQLKISINKGLIFRGFGEGPITFPPTYKYNLRSQKFDTSHKQRTPSYTDRILFKHKGRGLLECLYYYSVPSMCTSDHKPVWGLFQSIVRPGLDTIPLAAGLFKRDIYLEGLKRRATAMSKRDGTSTICSIQ